MPRYHTYARAVILGQPDGRSKEGLLLRSVKRDLFNHFGSEKNVTLPQRILCERVAHLQLMLSKFEERACRGELTPHDHREYVCYSNSLARALTALGIGPREQKAAKREAPTLSELFP
jgi:hypothetical protein